MCGYGKSSDSKNGNRMYSGSVLGSESQFWPAVGGTRLVRRIAGRTSIYDIGNRVHVLIS